MDFSYLLEPYNKLTARADQAFKQVQRAFPDCVKCEPHCSDCCHAFFGLFLIEAVFLKHDFDQLGKKERSAALKRCDEADKKLEALERTLKEFKNDPQMSAYSMSKARIRCPLLDDNHNCVLYPFRPITCRAYGIPTVIQGKARVCNKAAFLKGKSYPAFDLDGIYRELYSLSKELLNRAGQDNNQRASLLISVSKIIKTPVEELIYDGPVKSYRSD